MPSIHDSRPRIIEIADQILADIKSRHLSDGDSYLTTAAVAKRLRIGTATANRSMQLLVQQGILKRSNRAGCVIAGLCAPAALVSRVHLLVPQEHMRTEGLLADGLIVGLQSELPGAEMLFNFLPQQDDEDFLRQLITETMRKPAKAGLILARSSFALQSQVAAAALPAVVLGTPYRAVAGLPSLDRDHAMAARQLVAKMLTRGCRRFVVLMRETEWPGDFVFLDALLKQLMSAGITMGNLKIRHLPAAEEAIIAETRSLLAESDSMTGVVCRSEPLAAGAAEAAAQMRRAAQVVVGVSDVYRGAGARPPKFLHVKTVWTAEQIGAKLGRMLKLQALGEPLPQRNEVIPIVLG